MRATNALSVLGLLALAVVSFLLLGQQGVQWLSPRGQKTATVSVTDAAGLIVGSRVLDRGVQIGHVASISVDAQKVDLALSYDGQTQIPQNATIRIENLSGLGEAYLAVLPSSSSGPYLADGARVDGVLDTSGSTVGALSTALSTLMRRLDPDAVNRILDRVGDALPGSAPDVASIESGANLVSVALLRQMPQIKDILASTQTIAPQADSVGPQLKAMAAPLRLAGHTYSVMAESTLALMHTNTFPDIIEKGPLELFKWIQQFEDRVGPDAKYLGDLFLPAVRAAAAPIATINMGSLLDTALGMTSKNAVTMHLAAPAGSGPAATSAGRAAPPSNTVSVSPRPSAPR
ncbi:MlaD family protein [Tsukamurella sp. 8F]|uniref:MlaD family protein n=1 Tax=unclassified Tsukamurella TaxID=2633480 RepID=UPI0023B8B9BC|nr:MULTISPECIES: MlaD family protein [unclassified Tsukamurella]MDF0530741.1 MlaD family protein [Tsukamurella sp. 8J]MDF0587942.1 MlaD family protein [Tsukamurella sp. 8F]